MPNRATYNITNDKIKLFIDRRLNEDEYKESKSHNFAFWHGSKCFAAKWSTGAEDFALKFVSAIEEDDSPDDVEARVARFEKYAQADEKSAEYAAERLANANTDRRVRQAESTMKTKQDEAIYWQRRIAGAISHAERKDDPGVISRRIKGLEADKRKVDKAIKEHESYLAIWSHDGIDKARAVNISNRDSISRTFPKSDYPDSSYEGRQTIWSALNDGTITAEQAQGIAVSHHESRIAFCKRIADHLSLRLDYERSYLEAVGGAALLEPQERAKPRRSTAPDDGLKKGDIVTVNTYFVGQCRTLTGKILSLGALRVKIQLPKELDSSGWYAKGYPINRSKVKKVTEAA